MNMQIKFHLLYIVVIVVLVALLLASKRQIKVVENRVTDTIVKVHVDTITSYVPKYIVKKTIDTLYLPTNNEDKVALTIEQRHYQEKDVYDAWVSGYQPALDSIRTYPRIEYRTITNSVTKEIYKSTLDFYPYTGFRTFDGSIGQVIGLSVKMPKTLVVSGEIGVMDNKMIYGVNLGFKIN